MTEKLRCIYSLVEVKKKKKKRLTRNKQTEKTHIAP